MKHFKTFKESIDSSKSIFGLHMYGTFTNDDFYKLSMLCPEIFETILLSSRP